MVTKVLIVDDEQMTLQALDRLLRRSFTVFACQSVDEAETLLVSEQPEIVIADYTMPKKNGLDFLRSVEEKSPNSIRCILTGQIESHELSEAINTHLIHRLFLKPWENSLLLVQLQEASLQQKLIAERNILAKLAVTDPVTQVHNHRYFQDQLSLEIDRAKRHSRNLCLLMLDIDYFKSFNDRFGHPAGDRALFEIAEFLKSTIRSIDHLARYGGEEFAIILPDTSLNHGTEVAERICAQFKAQFTNGPRSTPGSSLTISIGLSAFPEHGKSAAEVLASADSALYLAKNSGRDRYKVAR